MNIEILQCPQWVNNSREFDKFFEKLSIYSGRKVSIVFKGNVIEDAFENFTDFFKKYDVKFDKIVFENVIFKEYVRFVDIQCDELEFLFVKFERGGALKNRKGKFGLDIGNLIFKPSQIENAFVIDIGNYANSQGFLETEKVGRIRNIEFENHKEGKGQIYFIGLNSYMEIADFKNKVLDNVSFQNCNLSNCYFLNAKVDKAEFRNCVFPEIKNHKYVNGLYGKSENFWFIALFFFIPPVMFYLFDGLGLIQNGGIAVVFGILPIFLLWMGALNAVAHPIEYYISPVVTKKNTNVLNDIKGFHHHFGVSDEVKINAELEKFRNKNVNDSDYMIIRNQLQQSYFNLTELYKQFKESFEKSDFQTAGNFFYSQRYIEMISTSNKKSWSESWLLNVHYFVNGFGERFFRPLIFLCITLIVFMFILNPKEDYIATVTTPLIFIENNDKEIYIMNQTASFFGADIEKNDTNSFLFEKKIDRKYMSQYVLELKETLDVRFCYSLSHLNLPFASENQQWFKKISQNAIWLSFLESILLWFFGVAFALAVFHRIKR